MSSVSRAIGAAFGERQRLDGAQVVGSIRELDQNYAQIAHHREQHFAEVLRLGFLAILELDLIELGDAIDDLGDVVPETPGDIRLRDRGILDDVVQDRADQGIGIEMQVREDLGGRHRVGDIGLAGDAGLPLVGGGAELGGLTHAADLVRGEVAPRSCSVAHGPPACRASRRGAIPTAKTHSPRPPLRLPAQLRARAPRDRTVARGNQSRLRPRAALPLSAPRARAASQA